jgi:hypothetical protein
MLDASPMPASMPAALVDEERKCIETLHAFDQHAVRTSDTRPGIGFAYARVSARYGEILREISTYAPGYVQWLRGSTVSYENVRRMLCEASFR